MQLHSFLPGVAALGYFLASGISQAIAFSVVDPSTIAAITPTEIRYPAGASGYFYPSLTVQGNTTGGYPGTPQSRFVMEFPLSGISASEIVSSAILDITTFGGTRGLHGVLEYGLFGYAGTGSLSLASGSGGTGLAGPYFYDIDFGSANPTLNGIDVTAFVGLMVESGASHVGFSLRDSNTAPGSLTDGQFIVVQDSPYWAGDVPPRLTVTTEEAPRPVSDSGSTLILLGGALGVLFKTAPRKNRVRR